MMRAQYQRDQTCSSRCLRTSWGIVTPLLISIALSRPLDAQVRFEVSKDSVGIEINGQAFSVLHFGKEEHKPFLHPLLTPSGKNVLRGFPVNPLPGDSTDRPHQRGVWMGTEGLKGPSGIEDFW